MAEHKYSFEKYKPETMARVVGRSLPISTKHSIEICNHIRGKKLSVVKRLLREAINKERPIPFKKFNDDVGHKKGPYSSARYPVKAATSILKLIESCEANAQNKALNTDNMAVIHTNAHKGSQQLRHGRHRRRLMKRTHVEVVLEELSQKEPKKPAKKKSTGEKETKSEAQAAETSQSSEKTETSESSSKKTTKKEQVSQKPQEKEKTSSKQPDTKPDNKGKK